MSRSQNAVELCALLVDETYGELASRIFTILLRKGRLPISEITKHTRLGPRAVRHGLTVLIQQNLIYWESKDKSPTFYEASSDAAYALVRSGKIMELVENRYGASAKDVVQNLFLLGHTKISDLAEAYASQQKRAGKGKSNGHTATNGVNGHTNPNIEAEGQLDAILIELLGVGLIEPVVKRVFRCPADVRDEFENGAIEEAGGSVKGSVKKKAEVRGKVEYRLEKIEAEDREWKSKILNKPRNGILTNGVNGSGKKRRLSHGGGSVNGDHPYEDDGTRLDPNLVIRINHEKCTVLLRNFQLVEAAKNKIGETTSQVYAELLRRLEHKVIKCHDDMADDAVRPSISTKDVASSLSKSVNVSLGIGKAVGDGPKAGQLVGVKLGSPPATRKRKVDDVDGSGGEEEDEPAVNGNGKAAVRGVDLDDDDPFADDPFAEAPAVREPKRQKVTFEDKLPKHDHHSKEDRIVHVKDHMLLLGDDKYGFIRKEGANGGGEWSVNFSRVIRHIQEAETDRLVLEIFGPTGHRLVRMLRELGKLDEKQLKDTTLMKQKDIRTKLAEMQLSGWVDIQEVPKDASRGANNNRVIFLWFFDNERCATLVLDHTYKAMSRLLQRLDVERRRAKSVLELTHRSDVRDKPPDEYLAPSQLNELHAFQDREELLLAQVGRLDEIVGIFKDY